TLYLFVLAAFPAKPLHAFAGNALGRRAPFASGVVLGALDGGYLPVAAVTPQEGPGFHRFRKPVGIAGDECAGGPVAHHIDAFVTHGDGGVFVVAFAPGFGDVTLDEVDVAHFVAQALRGVVADFLGEIGHGFR